MDRWLCLDPGSTNTGVVQLEGDNVVFAENMSNQDTLRQIAKREHSKLVCESVEYLSRGAGKTLIDTIFWSGVFCWESARGGGSPYVKMPRVDVKKILLGKGKWKDGDVRRRVIDIYAGPGQTEKDVIGLKASPGVLYGLSSHTWQALACGLAHRIERGVCELPGVHRGTLLDHLVPEEG